MNTRALLLLVVAAMAGRAVMIGAQQASYPLTVVAPGKGPYTFPEGYQTPWEKIEIRVTEKMSPNLFVLHGSQGLDAAHPDASGGRALALFGPDGVLLVDTQNRQVADKTLKAIRSNNWIEGSLQDVTERSKAIERLRFLAEHDSLTGSLNRRGVEKAIAAESEETLPWALAYVDLDRFKLVNDLFGHRAGDEVLKQVAGRTRALFKRDYAVGRIGGDEFVCVMSDTQIDDAIAQCHELIAVLSE